MDFPWKKRKYKFRDPPFMEPQKIGWWSWPHMKHSTVYPLVMTNIAIENDH